MDYESIDVEQVQPHFDSSLNTMDVIHRSFMQTSIIPLEEASSVLAFWFEELDPGQWFRADEGLDNLIRSRFGKVHAAAAQCELWPWRATPSGRLAEIIVLDQFSRNMYRGSAKAFECDKMALALSQEALRVEADKALTVKQKTFLFMPFMHSESLAIHDYDYINVVFLKIWQWNCSILMVLSCSLNTSKSTGSYCCSLVAIHNGMRR